MDLNLANKTVVVTGGGSNIGRAISLGFAKEGCNVVIGEIDEEQGNKVSREASLFGGKITSIKVDVTSYESATMLMKKTVEQCGKIDILINNVGWLKPNLFRNKPMDEIEKEINLCLWSCIYCTKAVSDHMIACKYGRIVNISSIAGLMGMTGNQVYSMCKGGIIALTRSLAKELGHYNITVNAICPALIVPESTEHMGNYSVSKSIVMDAQAPAIPPKLVENTIAMTPLGRVGRPNDIANLAVFLASDAASFISGEAIAVSGGYPLL